MAKAIKQVENDFQDYDGEQNTNIVYVVGDGVETCGGSPVKKIQSLHESTIDPVVNIIGYQVDNEGLKQLKEMAQAAEGRYINAKSQEDLTDEFAKTADLAEIWSNWERDAKETIHELEDTIKHQLHDWHKIQKKRMSREHTNLKAANNYLHDQDIIDRSTYLDYSDAYRSYYLDIAEEARDQYLELAEANRDEFFDKYDEVEKRYKKAED